MDTIQDKLIEGLKNGDQKVFNNIFEAYYAPLCRYCARIVYDPLIAEEIVQDLFCKIWVKREEIEINSSLKAYLYKAALNHAINYLEHIKTEEKYRQFIGFNVNESLDYPLDILNEEDVKRVLSLALHQMPEKRRMIFEMSRNEDMRYQEIADKLNISVKTVESQMARALEYLRKIFSDVLGIFFPLAISSEIIGNEIIKAGIQAVI